VLFSIAGGNDLTMHEIQEAAKIITESVDPNAKIIFGTVRDEKLKKNELKITVIATGFPENVLKKSLFQNVEKKENLEKSGKIYNSLPEFKKEIVEPSDEKKTPLGVEEDDWGVVPAFLRRNKK